MSGGLYSVVSAGYRVTAIDLSDRVTSSSDIDVIEVFYGSHSPAADAEVKTISFLFFLKERKKEEEETYK